MQKRWTQQVLGLAFVGMTATNLTATRVFAEDLPSSRKSAPVMRQETKSCEQYGQGFIYVAASNTCVKIGGNVSVEMSKSGATGGR